MKENSKLVPEIRFSGFTDAWEQRKLGEVKDVRDGTHSSPVYVKQGHALVTSKNLTDYDLDLSNVSFISDEDFKLINQRSKVDIGDIIFGMIGTIGNPVLLTRDDFAIKNVALLKNDGVVENTFLVNLLKSPIFQAYVREENAGGTQKFIGLNQIRNFIFLSPDTNEQIKIGSFFKQLDNIVALYERKLTSLKQLKSGYLTKIFNQEVRFSGFYEDWEERKLADVFVKGGSGGTPTSSNKDYYNGDIPFLGISDISNSNGFIFDTQKHITHEAIKNSSAWLVPSGAISLAMYASVGKIAILQVDVATSQAFYNMIFKENSLRDFVYQRLRQASENKEWLTLISTGTQENLNANKVKNFMITIPVCKDEVVNITTFCNQLDHLITQQEIKVIKLKEIKKAYLKRIFV